MAQTKTTFGEGGGGKIISGRIGWKGTKPPSASVERNVILKVRARGSDALNALLIVLKRHYTGPGDFGPKLNQTARDEINEILSTLKRGDVELSKGDHNAALLWFVSVVDMVCEARCNYGKHPEAAY